MNAAADMYPAPTSWCHSAATLYYTLCVFVCVRVCICQQGVEE